MKTALSLKLSFFHGVCFFFFHGVFFFYPKLDCGLDNHVFFHLNSMIRQHTMMSQDGLQLKADRKSSKFE